MITCWTYFFPVAKCLGQSRHPWAHFQQRGLKKVILVQKTFKNLWKCSWAVLKLWQTWEILPLSKYQSIRIEDDLSHQSVHLFHHQMLTPLHPMESMISGLFTVHIHYTASKSTWGTLRQLKRPRKEVFLTWPHWVMNLNRSYEKPWFYIKFSYFNRIKDNFHFDIVQHDTRP